MSLQDLGELCQESRLGTGKQTTPPFQTITLFYTSLYFVANLFLLNLIYNKLFKLHLSLSLFKIKALYVKIFLNYILD